MRVAMLMVLLVLTAIAGRIALDVNAMRADQAVADICQSGGGCK